MSNLQLLPLCLFFSRKSCSRRTPRFNKSTSRYRTLSSSSSCCLHLSSIATLLPPPRFRAALTRCVSQATQNAPKVQQVQTPTKKALKPNTWMNKTTAFYHFSTLQPLALFSNSFFPFRSSTISSCTQNRNYPTRFPVHLLPFSPHICSRSVDTNPPARISAK